MTTEISKQNMEFDRFEAEYLGILAGKLEIPIDLDKAEKVLSTSNLPPFMSLFAYYNFDHLYLAAINQEGIFSGDERVRVTKVYDAPLKREEYRSYLEFSLDRKLEHMARYGQRLDSSPDKPDIERIVAERFRNPFLLAKVEELEGPEPESSASKLFSKDKEPYDDFVYDRLFRLYGEAWASGPLVHLHSGEAALFLRKTYMKPELDNHAQMDVVLRALGFTFANSATRNEEKFYFGLNSVTDWDHYKIGENKVEVCNLEKCDR